MKKSKKVFLAFLCIILICHNVLSSMAGTAVEEGAGAVTADVAENAVVEPAESTAVAAAARYSAAASQEEDASTDDTGSSGDGSTEEAPSLDEQENANEDTVVKAGGDADEEEIEENNTDTENAGADTEDTEESGAGEKNAGISDTEDEDDKGEDAVAEELPLQADEPADEGAADGAAERATYVDYSVKITNATELQSYLEGTSTLPGYLDQSFTVSNTTMTITGSKTLWMVSYSLTLSNSYLKVSGGSLSISNSSGDSTITTTNDSDSLIQLSNNASLTLNNDYTKSLSIKNTKGTSILSTGNNTITMNSNVVVTGKTYGISMDGGTLTMSSGTTVTGSTNGGISMSGGTLTMNGGTVNGGTYGISMSGGTLTMSGGTVSGTSNGLYVSSSSVTPSISGTAVVKSTGADYGFYGYGINMSGGTVNGAYMGSGASTYLVSGGTLTGNITAESGASVSLEQSGSTALTLGNGSGDSSALLDGDFTMSGSIGLNGTTDVNGLITLTGAELKMATNASSAGFRRYNSGTTNDIYKDTLFLCTSGTNSISIPVDGNCGERSAGLTSGNGDRTETQSIAAGGFLFALNGGNLALLSGAELKDNHRSGNYYGSSQDTAANADRGGAVYVLSGTLKMADGASIKNCSVVTEKTNNGLVGDGGAVTVWGTDAVFEMTGGEISGCYADRWGGAVRVHQGTFRMSGGTITGNSCLGGQAPHYIKGGGVILTSDASGTLELSGTANITGNVLIGTGEYETADDVYNDTGSITVTGILTGENSIGISNPISDGTVFAAADSAEIAEASKAAFFADECENFVVSVSEADLKWEDTLVEGSMLEVYVKSTGSDDVIKADGGLGTQKKPFLTLAKAYRMAADGCTIHVMDEVVVSEQLKCEKNLTVSGEGFSDAALKVEAGKTLESNNVRGMFVLDNSSYSLTLKDICLDGNGANTRAVRVSGGTLTLTGNCRIQNFGLDTDAKQDHEYALNLYSGTSNSTSLVVEGETVITGNHMGGVYLPGEYAAMTLSGKVIIEGNTRYDGSSRVASDVCFNSGASGQYVTIGTGGLSEGSRIGIGENTGSKTDETVFAKIGETVGEETLNQYAEYFFDDSDEYCVDIDVADNALKWVSPAARIGEEKYATLQKAFDAALSTGSSGENDEDDTGESTETENVTIYLLKDLSLQKTVTAGPLSGAGADSITLTSESGTSEETLYYTIDRKAGFTDTMLALSGGTAALTLTLRNIIFDGGLTDSSDEPQAATASLLSVAGGASLIVDTGAVIRNNGNGGTVESEAAADGGNAGTAGSGTGGGVYLEDGSLTLNAGGEISGCSAGMGGGVYLKSGSFTMNGGSVTACSAETAGGGVYVNGGTFTMTDGMIQECSAGTAGSGTGGGVYLYDSSDVNMKMTGGSITACSAEMAGGIYVPPSAAFRVSGGPVVRANPVSTGTAAADVVTGAGSGDASLAAYEEDIEEDGTASYSNIYLASDDSDTDSAGRVIQTGDLEDGAKLGITHAEEPSEGTVFGRMETAAAGGTDAGNGSYSGYVTAFFCDQDRNFEADYDAANGLFWKVDMPATLPHAGRGCWPELAGLCSLFGLALLLQELRKIVCRREP